MSSRIEGSTWPKELIFSKSVYTFDLYIVLVDIHDFSWVWFVVIHDNTILSDIC